MQFTVPSGKATLKAEVPDTVSLEVVDLGAMLSPCADEAAEIRRAMDHPIGTDTLASLAASQKTVAIIVSDHTRLTPSRMIVPEILKDLKAAGIAEENVTIAVATGMHRKTTQEELLKMLGSDIVDRFSICVHHCEDSDSHVDLGTTSRGTPIRVERCVAEADLVIGLGCIEPHQQAGWSGGAKIVMPGVSARKSVLTNHAHSYHPDVVLGRLEGNPFREDLEEYAALAGLKFIVNTIVTAKGEIFKAVAGHPVKAHRAGVAEMKKYIGVPLEKKPDVTVVSVNGHPRDLTLWMSEGKALARIYHAIPDGGIAILTASCSEGFGDPGFKGYLGNLTADEIIDQVPTEAFSIPGFKSYCIANHLKRASLYLVVQGLGSDSTPRLPIRYFTTIQDAVNEAVKEKGPACSMMVVPDGPSVLLQVA